MALVDSRPQRILTLCGLYLAQGIPWGFMLITLPSYLAYRYRVGDDEIGQLTALILVPWSFKLIWAPIMDTFTIRSMGRRRPWIIGSELMMAVTLLGFIGLGDPSEKLRIILWMYFLHNCFASLQDVCTDALAVDILPPHEQGQTNGMMWGSKLVGKGIGAWSLSYVLNWGGIEACVAVQVALLLGILLIPILVLERKGERRFPWSPVQPIVVQTSQGIRLAGKDSRSHVNPQLGSGPDLSRTKRSMNAGLPPADLGRGENIRNPNEIVRDYLKAFSLTTTLVYVAFTLTKLVGVGVNEVVTKTLYTQQLEPRWTDVDYSTAAGLYAMGPIILGALLGGFLADRFGRRLILMVGYGGYGVAALTFAAFPAMWNEGWFAMSYVLSCETLNAVGSVGFLSMAMRISWTKSAATVFTTYMTLSNVSHVAGNWMAGWVRELFRFSDASLAANLYSYELTFWFVGAASIAPLLFLVVIRPAQVDAARLAESSPNTLFV